MRKLSRVAGSLAVIVCAALVANCEDPKPNIPTSPGQAHAGSVEITGPNSVPPGQSVQFGALVHLTTGTNKLATSPTVRWFSSNAGLLGVNALGVVSAGQTRGDVILTVEVPAVPASGTRRASREIVILPDGTYRLVGVVGDAEFPGSRLAGVRVEVTSGAPVSATTDSSGQFRLYGVPPDADIQVTRQGYEPLVQHVHLTGNGTQNFQLLVSGPRPNLSGNYTLAIDVPTCPGSNPLTGDLLHRRYDAVLTQGGAIVTLTEPRFRTNSLGRGDNFSGHVDGGGATFTLDSYGSYYYFYYGPTAYPNVAERLPNNTYLVVAGTVSTTLSGGVLSGDMNGYLELWDSKFPNGNWLGACYASVPHFTLTPR